MYVDNIIRKYLLNVLECLQKEKKHMYLICGNRLCNFTYNYENKHKFIFFIRCFLATGLITTPFFPVHFVHKLIKLKAELLELR